MEISDIPKDLLEQILSRVPVKSVGAVRSTCKDWNTLAYDESFTKKVFGKTIAAKENEFLVIIMMDYKVYLMSVNLNGLHKDDDKNNVKSSIMHKGKLISLNDDADYRVDNLSNVFHCDGLLLCISIFTSDIRLVVWNPFCGQTRRIKPNNIAYNLCDNYALGYNKNKNNSFRNYKILRFGYKPMQKKRYVFEIYNFKSDSWKSVYFTTDWRIPFCTFGVSLKGNTYWFASEMFKEGRVEDLPNFLICFDFTTETFGQRLGLPFHSDIDDVVTLSNVREEQLAVLIQRAETVLMRTEIWVTTKIDPEEVSWDKLFLAVNMSPHIRFWFKKGTGSFFIDEKKNVAVVLHKDVYYSNRNLAYIIGKDGYFKEVDIGETTYRYNWDFAPLVCSYVPSSMKLKQDARVMQQHRSVISGKYHGIISFGVLVLLGIFLSYFCFG